MLLKNLQLAIYQGFSFYQQLQYSQFFFVSTDPIQIAKNMSDTILTFTFLKVVDVDLIFYYNKRLVVKHNCRTERQKVR
jgi:hypothetical protein